VKLLVIFISFSVVWLIIIYVLLNKSDKTSRAVGPVKYGKNVDSNTINIKIKYGSDELQEEDIKLFSDFVIEFEELVKNKNKKEVASPIIGEIPIKPEIKKTNLEAEKIIEKAVEGITETTSSIKPPPEEKIETSELDEDIVTNISDFM